MSDSIDFHRLASLMADPARARILWTLVDGTTRPAGELAFAANISAQSASGHLAKLVQGGLLVGEAVGRHRYYRIVDPEVAAVLESLASLNAGMTAQGLLTERRPHVSGALGAALLDVFVREAWILRMPRSRVVSITPKGRTALQRTFGASI